MKKILGILFSAVLLISLCACQLHDGPPTYDRPLPEPLHGVYSGEYGTLTFGEDGKNVDVSLAKGDATISGEMSCTFSNGVYYNIGYDVAAEMKLVCGSDIYGFHVNSVTADKINVTYLYHSFPDGKQQQDDPFRDQQMIFSR